VATSAHTTVEIAGNSANSMLLDDISFVELPATNYNNYFMPEESLAPFTGEDPEGCWTLDVWDTRNDSVASNSATLLSWTLDMTFSSTNINLIVLTNHAPYTNSAPLPANTFFAFDVPSAANYATNTLTDMAGVAPLSLVFNQTALPADSSPGDFTLIANDLIIPSNTLSTLGSVPPLVPGTRYFLAVENLTPATAQQFVLRVDTDVTSNGVIGLTNEVPYDTVIATKSGQLYSFDVPPDATMATFQITNATGEVDLYAHYGLPLPSPSIFDYESAVFGTNNQSIVVYTNSLLTTNSAPVPLLPGRWYLAVYTPGTTAVSYDIVATAITNALTNSLTIIPLNGQPANSYTTNAPPGFSTLFYSFVNSSNDTGVSFAVNNIKGGNVDLLVGLDALPSPQQSYAGSFNPGTTPEFVQAPATNSHTWYLAVPNNTNTAVTYTIVATDLTTGVVTTYPAISSGQVVPGFGFTLSWNSIPGENYEVDYSTDLVNWAPAITFTATNSQSSFTDFTPISGHPARYYRVQQVP
jgi:hypothetical protein